MTSDCILWRGAGAAYLPGFENLGLVLREREFESRPRRLEKKKMAITKEKRITVSGAVVSKKATNGKISWFLIKHGEDPDWQIPKVTARKGESSVRASIRMMAESGGMNIRVYEEAGRSGGTMTVNGVVLPKTTYYYFARQINGGEVLAFEETGWFEYSKALNNLKTKFEKEMLKSAQKFFKLLPEIKEIVVPEVEPVQE